MARTYPDDLRAINAPNEGGKVNGPNLLLNRQPLCAERGDGSRARQSSGLPFTAHLTGGSGKDRIDGGPGADAIDVADGAAETVHCGRGRDRVTADKADRLIGCEVRRRT